MFLDYFALGLLIFVALVMFYGIIAIHDIPYEIAKEREHPHQDAIHYAGWVSLFTLHALWPFLWIWATLWRKERGWGFQQIQNEQVLLQSQISKMEAQIQLLQTELTALRHAPCPPVNPASQQKSNDNDEGHQ
ncbi:DUF3302 domain-containing protein [Photobacterium sp. CCB-ST2H9]|uniref:DUF3302 domain-containing protein n=1 Tax=unclassified Photobacterium TaxID=2628852 RepID=UPI0020031CF3|nr:DUF3302 domain-containing protein [Photobacterium sp. CCB-ST2H9]UTM58210.1 DUF3302 domain-containing protein [Photobacterium sp. CCB-ST2H9]